MVAFEVGGKDAARLNQLTATLINADTRSPRDAVSAGMALIEAKRLIGRGGFVKWCATELEWSHQTIARLIRAANHFAKIPVSQIVKFSSSALFVLSHKRCPEGARHSALRETAAGKTVTYTRARELRDAALPTRKPIAEVVPELESETRASPDVPELTQQHRAWLILEELMSKSSMIHLSREPDEDDGELVLCGRAYPADDSEQPRFGVRRTLEFLVAHLAGSERRKVCGGCKVEKSLEQFCRNSALPDGRNRRCLVCERKRLARMAANKKREKREKR